MVVRILDKDIKVEGQLIRTARLDAEKFYFLNDPEPLLEGLRKCGARIDIFTFLEKITGSSEGSPESSPKFAYQMEWDNLAVLPVSTFDHWWTQQIGFKARNKAKQADKKRVAVREVPFNDALVTGIWEVYNECPVRQGKPFWHYGKDVETVRKLEATYLDSSIFIGAFFEDKLIGFIKLVTDESQTQAGLMNIVSMVQHRDKAPTNALIAQAVRSCADRSIRHLVYSNFAYGKKQRDSLSDFKERNGFMCNNVPRYYVPLTRLGRAALSLGLHHKLVDRIPESIVTKGREFRNSWYNRKLRTSDEG